MRRLNTLEAWRVGVALSRSAYRLTLTAPLNRHFELAGQIRRAAVSLPANIAEGYGLGTRPQFIRCLRISLGSAYELAGHLDLAVEVGLADKAAVASVREETRHLIRLLVGLLKRLGARTPG